MLRGAGCVSIASIEGSARGLRAAPQEPLFPDPARPSDARPGWIPSDGGPEAARRYSPPRCTGVKVRIQAGAPRQDRINTSFVERSNLTVRHFNKRFARLGLGWSRKLENHKHAISLFIAAYNFCKVHSTLGCTPAVGLKLTDHVWTIEELVQKICSSET